MSAIDQHVRETLDQYFRTAEQCDLEGFLALFSKGDDLTAFEDNEMYDWEGLVGFVGGFFEQMAKIRIQLERCAVNSLVSSVAVATGVFNVVGMTTSGEEVSFRNCFTFVFVNEEGQWLIKHVHESSL